MSLNSNLLVSAVATHTKVLDLATGEVPLSIVKRIPLTNGTGANQADRIWHDKRQIAASGVDDLDLAGGSLTDAFGDALTFVKVKALIVEAEATNVEDVVIGGDATAAFVGPFGAAAHTVEVKPGGVAAFVAPGLAGWPVTAGTADILQIANGGAGGVVDYNIVIIGTSA